MSKDFSCGEYRISYLSNQLDDLYLRIKSMFSCVSSCGPIPLQYGAAHALSYNDEIVSYLDDSKVIFEYIGNKIYNLLIEANIPCSKPGGGWYIFLDLSQFVPDNKKLQSITSGNDLMLMLLNEIDVLIVAGENFNYNKYSFRYSFVDIQDNLAEYYQTGNLSVFNSSYAAVSIKSI